jgi:hypothetical protein
MELDEPSSEMIEFFEVRTNAHIKRVQNNLSFLIKHFPQFEDELNEKAKTHDESKFSDKELIPYIYLTWGYKCRGNGIKYNYPNGMGQKIDEAIQHHYDNNSHHPEFFPDIKMMQHEDLIEMVCDSHAMSQEFGGDTLEYIEKYQFKQFNFTDKQKNFIISVCNILKNM